MTTIDFEVQMDRPKQRGDTNEGRAVGPGAEADGARYAQRQEASGARDDMGHERDDGHDTRDTVVARRRGGGSGDPT